MASFVQIDGAEGEGGGQVIRVALCLSALHKIPVEIMNIRANRSKPGLAAQHLKVVELLKDMCQAEVEGACLGSTNLKFIPQDFHKKKHVFEANTKTAGCIGLIVQAALPCALFMPNEIHLVLKGGTNVPMGPPIEYLTEVFKPLLNKFGGNFDCAIIKRGYYPKGGGEVSLKIKPVKQLKAVTMTEIGLPTRIFGWAYIAGTVPMDEAYKMIHENSIIIKRNLKEVSVTLPPVNIQSYREDRHAAPNDGSGINIICHTDKGCILGGSSLGSTRRNKFSPEIHPSKESTAAEEVTKPFVIGACVDEHAQDQIVILMTLAEGKSKIRVGKEKLTRHTETAIEVAKKMLTDKGVHFELKEVLLHDNTVTFDLEIIGCGFTNSLVNKN